LKAEVDDLTGKVFCEPSLEQALSLVTGIGYVMNEDGISKDGDYW